MVNTANEINTSLKNGKVIIAYMMVGCHWCDELKPIWQQIKKNNPNRIKEVIVSEKNPTILDDLDCDTNDTVKGFPCICAYDNGKKMACFKGDRTFETLTTFANKHLEQNQSGGKRKKYKRTSKTKRRKRKTRKRTTRRKKKNKRRKSSKARSAFYKKLKKRIKKKKKN